MGTRRRLDLEGQAAYWLGRYLDTYGAEATLRLIRRTLGRDVLQLILDLLI